jgi:hypothetical protein
VEFFRFLKPETVLKQLYHYISRNTVVCLEAIELRVISTSSDALGNHVTYIIAQWFPLVKVAQLRAQNKPDKGSVMHGNTISRRDGK